MKYADKTVIGELFTNIGLLDICLQKCYYLE